MSYNYDKYYKKRDYFGEPYSGLVSFFKTYEPKGSVLDLGCGQGRDTIMLGKLGYRVTGVDESAVGISQMNKKAVLLGIDVTGIAGDIYDFSNLNEYDIILMDSMLHFYKNDIDKEKGLVEKILSNMKNGSIFCNCMQKGAKRENILKKIIEKSGFDMIYDTYSDYPAYNSVYNILVVKKPEETDEAGNPDND